MAIVYPQFPRLADIGGIVSREFNSGMEMGRESLGVDAFGRYLDVQGRQQASPQLMQAPAAAAPMSLAALGNQAMGAPVQPVERAPLGPIGSPSAGTQPRLPDPATARVQQAHASALPSSFLSVVDRTEGAGSYDTLYGHAQNGPFRSVRVSQMPISQVLAFSSPSGAYGQHVKGQIGRVATPMGRHQIVGTTLRKAVEEMGLDPSQPFDAQTQDAVAAHLARRRLASASTMSGKMAALRSEWEGFKNVPDSQLAQIITDLEGGSGAVGAVNAMAQGQTPTAPQAALESMSVGQQMPVQGQQMAQMGGFPMPQGRQPVQLPPREVMMDLFRSPATRQLAINLAQAAQSGQQIEQYQTFQREDGSIWQMNTQTGQMQRLQEGAGGQGIINAGDGRLYDPNNGQWITAPNAGGAGGGFTGAAGERINRLTENLMQTGDFMDPQQAQNIAVGIVDGRLKSDRHPITGELQVVDMATGQVVYGGPQQAQQPQAQAPMTPSQPMPEFGQQYPNAPDAFGVGGAAQRAINTIGDATGVGAPYPEVQQAQSDFAVLRESLLNDIASSYGRQPPSWLLQEIRSLTPAAGSPFEGAGGAQTKLRSLGRHLSNELRVAQEALTRELSPTNRQEMETRVAGLRAGISRVEGALGSFGGRQQGQPEPGQQQFQEGQTATNPTTGERRVYRNGQWELLQ